MSVNRFTIDPEFQTVIPPLTDEERNELEKSILAEGCQDALVLWGNTLVDGHNRFEICHRHGISFMTRQMEFANRDEAKAWIIRNQFARRNISDVTRSRLALELKNMIAAQAKENLTTSTGGAVPRPLLNSTKAAPVNTREKIAEIAGVSGDIIYKVETVDANAPGSVKKAMEDGVISIHKAYKATKAALKDPDVKRKLEITSAAQIPEALLTDMEDTNRRIKRQGKIMDTWCMMARMDYSDDDYEIWLSDLPEDAIERQLEMAEEAVKRISRIHTRLAEICKDRRKPKLIN